MKFVLDKAKLLPFTLSAFIISLDQLVKYLIVKNWPLEGVLINDVFDNGILQFYHVRNRAIAFSIGHNLPDSIKPALFIILPVIVLALLLWYYFRSSGFLPCQRWAIAGIIGG